MRALPLVVFATLILPALGLGAWRLTAPASLAAGLGFAAVLASALLLSCAMSALIHIALLWTIAADGIT